MKKFVRLCDKLMYLGLLGLPMLISDALIFKLLWLFWAFGLISLIYDWNVFIQSLKQLIGIPYIYIAHQFKVPNPTDIVLVGEYSLPFKGEWTVINGGLEKETSHSWGMLSQRYAYDFLMLDSQGKSYEGDNKHLGSYYCYQQIILVPADGVVVEVKDKVDESRLLGNGQVDKGIKDIRGNYIVIQHGDKEYSVLAHLSPNTIKVKVGDRVKRGEEIAKCGNSGNSTEPHLHFQLQDGKSFFFSAGLPITFSSIKKVECGYYEKYDRRKIISKDSNYNEGNIRRGQKVKMD